MELFLFLVDEVAMFLAWFALSDIVLAVCFYGRPEVPSSKYSSGHGACAGMVAANAFGSSLIIYCACFTVTHLRRD